MVQTRSGALEGGENIGPGQSSTKPPSLMIRHKREKFYRNLLKTVNAPQAGKVSSMLHYVRIAEMLLCINKYIPQTSGPTVPSSYAGALISDLKNSNNFLEMLKCAEHDVHLMYTSHIHLPDVHLMYTSHIHLMYTSHLHLMYTSHTPPIYTSCTPDVHLMYT